MTIMQNEIDERSRALNNMAQMMAAGTVSVTPENESALQSALTAMLSENETARRMQKEAFEAMPWLNKKN